LTAVDDRREVENSKFISGNTQLRKKKRGRERERSVSRMKRPLAGKCEKKPDCAKPGKGGAGTEGKRYYDPAPRYKKKEDDSLYT